MNPQVLGLVGALFLLVLSAVLVSRYERREIQRIEKRRGTGQVLEQHQLQRQV